MRQKTLPREYAEQLRKHRKGFGAKSPETPALSMVPLWRPRDTLADTSKP